MSEAPEVVVVGAGYAGLGVSYFLQRRGIPHEVLERSRIGETWRSQRWDSFRLNTSNTHSVLPGDVYEGPEPWGAPTHHDFVRYLEGYAARHRLPVNTDTPVTRLSKDNGTFVLDTPQGSRRVPSVIVATGNLNSAWRPSWSSDLPDEIDQIDCIEYRNPAAMRPGAVLVVGSGQSGGQLAEELVHSGRKVFLATSRTGRFVRNYRGGDTFNWLMMSGFLDVPRREILRASGKPPPRALLGPTHTLSLQALSSQGVVLLGRFEGVRDEYMIFGDEVKEHIRFGDDASARIKDHIDRYIEENGIDAPAAVDDPAETVLARVAEPPISSIDWAAARITNVIWCTGFVGDFSWLQIPGSLDEAGQPLHEDGISELPGLYFAGLDFASTRKSGIIPGVAEDAERIINHLRSRLSLASQRAMAVSHQNGGLRTLEDGSCPAATAAEH